MPDHVRRGLGLAWGEVECSGAEADGRGVVEEGGGGDGVVWGGVGGADAQVVLEATDLGGLELGEGVGEAGDGGDEAWWPCACDARAARLR